MRIRTKIYLGILFVVSVGLFFLIDWIVDDLTPQYRESTEEPLVDAARVLASIAANSLDKSGNIDIAMFTRAFDQVYSQKFSAKIYNFTKTSVDYRVYITDDVGKVIFDSDNGRDVGADYSTWRDVQFTLVGLYGARTSRDTPKGPRFSVMYVAAPIVIDGEIAGVLSVGKPTENANKFVESAKRKIVIGGLLSGLSIIVIGIVISGMLTKPILALTSYATAIRDGYRPNPPKVRGKEIKELSRAFEEMRDSLEGKKYVEKYVQTLTHEFKSPLAAIKGAAELMDEDMPHHERERFLRNIREETSRLEGIIEKLLLLSNLEARNSPQELEDISLDSLVVDVAESLIPYAEKRGITVSHESDTSTFLGEPFLVRHALVNLLQNAIEFSPDNALVSISAQTKGREVEICIEDQGPGIPSYAKERIFERFYSLKRPHNGRKSSGLGLSLVREVVILHKGSITFEDIDKGGTRARLTLPTKQ